MSKFLLIILGIFLVLGTINFISALPCPTGQIPENDLCAHVPTEKMDQLPDLHGEVNKRNVINLVGYRRCLESEIWIPQLKKCLKAIKATSALNTTNPVEFSHEKTLK
jgi:hypothetical protein